ncbi:hypothetical protein [Sphingopyxis sp.]|uniref:hypothetical protein n=1 Tax=Sphingopyxis sp. TaxID=1908224 RepID=UPI002D788206|nr:hypothetical protein [Sphingopyxis sp.]HET6523092.1 hypothetical protein [Sphingopyxis sp.]
MDHIPVDTLYHATVISADAETTARHHSEFYGVERWDVTDFTPDRLTNQTIFGRVPTAPPPLDLSTPNPTPGTFGFRLARGTTPNGAITFNIVQPTGGLSTFEEFLVTRGPGIQGMCMTSVDKAGAEDLKSFFRGESIRLAQSYTVPGVAEFLYFDTRADLGGYYVEAIVPLVDDWQAAMPVDTTWSFEIDEARAAYSRTSPGITHFGVIVPQLRPVIERSAKLFGRDLWRGMHWRTEPGSLEEPTNNGKPVKHSYFTGRADLGKNSLGQPFGLEIVQPVFGPSHYKEDFLEPLGAGIHHIDLKVPMADWAEWEKFSEWLLEDMDAPVCMSGWLRDKVALFEYHDLRPRLGYVVELVAPLMPHCPKKPWAPDYWYDFAGSQAS